MSGYLARNSLINNRDNMEPAKDDGRGYGELALRSGVFAGNLSLGVPDLSDEDLAAVRKAGYSDAQVLEVVALVVENVFTNFVNEVAKTDIDFPVVQANDLKAA
jgi:hypothetical protein